MLEKGKWLFHILFDKFNRLFNHKLEKQKDEALIFVQYLRA